MMYLLCMGQEQRNSAAAELGRLGGQKTAQRGPEYYAEIQAKRQVRSGGRPKNPPKAAYEGELKIGEMTIPCAVLEDGTRLLTLSGFMRALGRARQAKGRQYYDGDVNLPAFLTAKNLKSFIPKELEVTSSQIEFRPLTGGRAYGYRAELLPKVCDVFLDAEKAEALRHDQVHIAAQAHILIRGLAHTGIAALVDEATGYQEVRDRHALQAILDAYLQKEFAAWAKRFPDEFYEQMFRLRGWQWRGMKVNRPQVVGKYTNDLVYERLAPGILKELEERNPKVSRGERQSKHHQWLTEDVGHPALAQHLYGLIGFMRASEDWEQFYHLIQKAYPKKGSTLMLPLQEAKP